MGSRDRHITEEHAKREISRAAAVAGGLISDDPTLVSQDIAQLSPYRAGKPWRELAVELGIKEGEMMMLAANENVLGPSEKAVAAARAAMEEAHLYPDGGATALKRALARRHGVSLEHIAVGNGSNEIIELLVRTFVGPGETVVTAWPSFVVYRLITQAHGREMLIAPLRDDRYDLAAMSALVDRRTKLVFIANPNNPTGTYLPKRALAAFLDRIPRSVIVVLDEAYFEYANAPDYPDGVQEFFDRPRMVVLRTFSKIYGLAGLRIGYGVMDPALVAYMDCVRQPYNTNSVGQAAALAALSDDDHVKKSQRLVSEGRVQLEKALLELGVKTVPSQTNFVLARLGKDTSALVEKLRVQGIFVRDMRGYDMPETVRITVGTRAMNQRVIEAMSEAL
jgi:histidinol-phosphate aminotransferase